MPSSTTQLKSNFDYAFQACDYLPFASYKGALSLYREILNDPNLDDWVVAQIGLFDRFFLLTMILGVSAVFKTHRPEWIYERCREVESEPDDHLDLWAREHWKSTLITFAGAIQEIAKDSKIYPELFPEDPDVLFRGPGSEITIGIFSHNTKIARDFVSKIKRECEDNPLLPRLYPDIFWQDPKKQSPSWSRDNGLIFIRESNPNEPTVSGWGLVDGLPTSKHFKLMIYDDVVTEKSVGTPDMILKTTDSWELSSFLEASQSDEVPARKWYIGTRYNFADTYAVMISRGAAKSRLHPATDSGVPDGKPVLLSEGKWAKKKRDNSARTIACQMLQNPIAGDEQEFKPKWMRRWEVRPEILNVAILVDPASSKKRGSSNTAMPVIGLDQYFNKYLLDGACHKMNLEERWLMLKGLRNKWLRQPGIQVVMIGYEKYGLQADIEHFEQMMKIEKISFSIDPVSWTRDHVDAKDDRIRRLIPDHQNWRFFYPWEPDPNRPEVKDTGLMREADSRGKGYLCAKPIKRKNEDGRLYNLVQYLIANEYLFFPATTMKDLLDAMSRIYDLDINPPQIVREEDTLPPYEGEA